ncbi:hypothetical protein H4R99_006882 [Coemansia sp. RSA 1722]|nr:hypothetical protein LPJ57_002836 [Coemansia sp. RSA 486]KAJ2230639.1 hypothetical protein IWW45_005721 [Coemansia sp. RSA 485]KAJ2591083.1 hypothetical protein H4R99_006882 [Coemansia sp. RSA 1722]
MFRSNVKRAAKKTARAVAKIGRKAKSLASSCELAVKRVHLDGKWKVKPYPQGDVATVAFTLDYMDTVELANHFYNNLYAQQEWPVEELNGFDILRHGLFNESCSGKADCYSVYDFNGAELPETSEITEVSKRNNTELGQERAVSNKYGSSSNASPVAVDGISTQIHAETDSGHIVEHGYAMGPASATDSVAGSSPISESTFIGEYGLKEPLAEDLRTLQLVGHCMEYLPVLREVNAQINITRTAAGIAYANDIMHVISKTVDQCKDILDALGCGVDADSCAEQIP